MATIHEGETGSTQGAEDLIFPDINSCLTVTCACEGGVVIGGHAVLIPEANQLSLVKIVEVLKRAPVRKHLFLIGDNATWDQNLSALTGGTFSNLRAVATALNLGDKVSLIDVEKWTNGGKGMVQIVFHPATKTMQILPNQGGKALHEEKW